MENNLFSLADGEFYFDLDRISEFIKLEKQQTEIDEIFSDENTIEEVVDKPMDDNFGQMIDITKWELTKGMIETLLSEQGEIDESMGFKKLESQLSIPFRFSFNTLVINKILKKNK